MIKVALIDDHPVVLEGLSSGLSHFPDIDVVGTATGSDDARSLIQAGGFDILVTDLNLPEIRDGLELIEYSASLDGDFKIVVLTYSDRPDDVFNANQAGACAYLIKDANLEEIADALSIVYKGGRPALSPELESALWQRLKNSRPAHMPYDLSEREWNVLKLMAKGATNEEIAAQLFVSPRVVRRANTSLYRKLGVRNRSEAIAKAVSEELFGPH